MFLVVHWKIHLKFFLKIYFEHINLLTKHDIPGMINNFNNDWYFSFVLVRYVFVCR